MEKEYPTHCECTLSRHQGPVYVTKFNSIFCMPKYSIEDGNYLMSGSQDKTINVYIYIYIYKIYIALEPT